MGATLDAMQSDAGVRLSFVVRVEGYPYLLTDASASAAVTAYSASGDWTQALGGLFLHGDFGQSIKPWSGDIDVGSFGFSVMDVTGDDTLGIDVFGTNRGNETLMRETANCTDTQIKVKQTSTFDASGEAYIGIECFGYTSTTTTAGSARFNSATRGKYAPFRAGSVAATATRFARDHALSYHDYNVARLPYVTSEPRSWVGRWVEVRAHRNIGGTLDTLAESERILAGRIVAVRDAGNGVTRFECEDARAAIRDSVLMRDQYRAKVKEGVFVASGTYFYFSDRYGSVAQRDANPLYAVPSGASGANEMNEGTYTVSELVSIISRWLYSETAAARLYGYHEFGISTGGQCELKSNIAAAASTDTVRAIAAFNPEVWAALGVTALNNSNTIRPTWRPVWQGDENTATGQEKVKKYVFPAGTYSANNYFTLTVEESGTFIDNQNFLPADVPAQDVANSGVCLLDNKSVHFFVRPSAGTINLYQFTDALAGYVGGTSDGLFASTSGSTKFVTIDYDDSRTIDLSQVLLLQGAFADLATSLFVSTGTSGYNHSTYDTLPSQLGAAIPWGVLGDDFFNSLRRLDEAVSNAPLKLLIDKPTKLSDALAADMILRRASIVMKNGSIRFVQWTVPRSGGAGVFNLSEATKASPGGFQDLQIATTEYSDANLVNMVKIEYGRQLDGSFTRFITIRDDASIDEVGGTKAVTISARNTFAHSDEATATVERLATSIGAWLPLFSRPMMVLRVPVNQTLFAQMAPGDFVAIDDNNVRDPDTGTRGITSKIGIVLGHRFDWGGAEPGGNIRPQGGEVDIALYPNSRVADYSPAATIDNTYTTGTFTNGYSSATNQIKVKTNDFTIAASEDDDATFFVAGDAVRVYEIDPLTPGSPRYWDRAITAVSGDLITLGTALAGFSTSELYRVESQDYATATATQKLNCYQADDGDDRVVDSRLSYHFSTVDDDVDTSATSLTQLPEHPSGGYEDGRPMEPGRDRAAAILANNLVAYKTRPSAPVFFMNGAAAITSTTDYKIIAVLPLYVQTYGPTFPQTLEVSPFFKRQGASGTGYVRVTVCGTLPASSDTSWASGAEVTAWRYPIWQSDPFTTTSTTYNTPTAGEIELAGMVTNGVAWLVVEGQNAACMGLGICRFKRGLE